MTATVTQRFTALDKANEIRVRRAELKRRIVRLGRPGAGLVAKLIRDCDEEVASMRVYELLRCIRLVGSERADDMMAKAEVGHGKRVSGLNDRQRKALAKALGDHAAGKEWNYPRTQQAPPKPPQKRPLKKGRLDRPFDSGAGPRPGGPRCRRCGEHLRRKGTYLCGFCGAREVE